MIIVTGVNCIDILAIHLFHQLLSSCTRKTLGLSDKTIFYSFTIMFNILNKCYKALLTIKLDWKNAVQIITSIVTFTACLEPLGLENFQLPDESLTSSSVRYRYEPLQARLGYCKQEMWCAIYRDLNQFLKVLIAVIIE